LAAGEEEFFGRVGFMEVLADRGYRSPWFAGSVPETDSFQLLPGHCSQQNSVRLSMIEGSTMKNGSYPEWQKPKLMD
jgi:hypothetical protein